MKLNEPLRLSDVFVLDESMGYLVEWQRVIRQNEHNLSFLQIRSMYRALVQTHQRHFSGPDGFQLRRPQ
jgi:hypothetical protein